MFKHFVTIFTLLSICALPLGPLSRARANTPAPATLTMDRDGKASCASCSGGCAQGASPLERLENLATLGRRTQVTPFAPLSRSTFEGANINFVNTATGSLAFAVTDMELPGLMPLVFQRAYSSDRQEDSGLGVG